MTFLLICWIMLGLATAFVAKRNNRNGVIAFFAGLLFGIFAFIGYALAGAKKTQNNG